MPTPNLKPDEREVIRLTNHFGKQANRLIKTGKLSPEHQQVIASCNKLATQIQAHAAHRQAVLEKREKLRKLVQDQAACPQCHKNSQLKLTGTARHEKGWQSNKYRCRRCNIQFTWNRPNNSWDMVRFMEDYLMELELNVVNEALPLEVKQQSQAVMGQIKQNINQLQPVLAQSDAEFAEMNQQDAEMARLLHNMKAYLQIEKIKLNLEQID
ncbi:hypothetical protein HUW51_22465 [Adhaeribacter swui]|uniref:Uncharacterized protein n=1 Tax=Adhaeribacter swui TaxID=2086471 RepID=A0A7G7GDV9_9BACT|nr:hypothetical protein [Adhaeribacter swui]QNF35343.1 hypothetical protein HUW51_22465 [Adhaeribacter swui]